MKDELTLSVSKQKWSTFYIWYSDHETRFWAIGMHQVTPVNTSSTSEWAFEKEGCAEWAWEGNLRTAKRTPQLQQLNWKLCIALRSCWAAAKYGGWGEGRGGEEWAVSHPGNGESRRDLGKNHHHHFKGSLEKKRAEEISKRIFI